jgi:adenylate kinase
VIVIFLGPPGSGKGTQSEFVSLELSLPHLSTGEILRNEIRAGTKLGDEIRDVVSRGELVSEDIINTLVDSRISSEECINGCVLDGYPRTISQAKFLYDLAIDEKIVVLYFDIDDDIVIGRIVGRYSCKSCAAIYHEKFCPTKKNGVCDKCGGHEFVERPDDRFSIVATRLLHYHEQTSELLSFLEKKENFFRVDAARPVIYVKQDIAEILKRC